MNIILSLSYLVNTLLLEHHSITPCSMNKSCKLVLPKATYNYVPSPQTRLDSIYPIPEFNLYISSICLVAGPLSRLSANVFLWGFPSYGRNTCKPISEDPMQLATIYNGHRGAWHNRWVVPVILLW